MYFTILLDIQGGSFSGLVDLFKQNGSMIIGVGFALAGLGVLKRIITNHEKTKEAIITWIVALVIFILIWQLL